MAVFLNKTTSAATQQQVIDFIKGVDIYNTDFSGERALRNSDVFTGINIIAGDIAQSPFKAKAPESEASDIIKLLNTQPKKYQSHYMMMYAVVTNLILAGNSYVLIHRDKNNNVRELEFVPSEYVTVIQDINTGEYRYDITLSYGNIMYKANPEDILHFRLSTTDGWLGKSPLMALNEEIALQTNGLKVLNDFFAKGVFSGGILKLLGGTLDNESKTQIRKDFERVNGSGGTIVLDDTQEFTANSINTEVLKLIQANKFSTQQIAKVLGIPLNRFGQELVNSQDSVQNDIYIASTIAMYEAAICDEINMKLGIDLRLDLSKLMKDTNEDRFRRIAEGKTRSDFTKALTINDARNYLGLEEIDGGDAMLGEENNNQKDVEVIETEKTGD